MRKAHCKTMPVHRQNRPLGGCVHCASCLYTGSVWAAANIEIVLDEDLTDDPVLTAEIATPAGRLKAMADVSLDNRTLHLIGLHLHGDDFGPNEFGSANLRRLADAVMEKLNCHAIIVEGATRTSGANPGAAPKRLCFRRRLRP